MMKIGLRIINYQKQESQTSRNCNSVDDNYYIISDHNSCQSNNYVDY